LFSRNAGDPRYFRAFLVLSREFKERKDLPQIGVGVFGSLDQGSVGGEGRIEIALGLTQSQGHGGDEFGKLIRAYEDKPFA
jgi:hypothetical protein